MRTQRINEIEGGNSPTERREEIQLAQVEAAKLGGLLNMAGSVLGGMAGGGGGGGGEGAPPPSGGGSGGSPINVIDNSRGGLFGGGMGGGYGGGQMPFMNLQTLSPPPVITPPV